ncbi:hypothetical protein [Kitasatospora sp. NPDC094011]|uniref:hypothetical protein n=1 Tax=Kitasatospora sp. NPDC094011 TaxID=3364090 RepID=UPI0038100015
MNRPEGWEWLDDDRRERWDVPESLRGPAASTPVNLAVAMLSCDFLGHELCVLVGRFVTEHAQVYLRPPGKGLTFREQSLISDVLTRHTRRTFEAWERFRVSPEQEGPAPEVRRLVQKNRELLATELEEAIQAFAGLPGSVL